MSCWAVLFARNSAQMYALPIQHIFGVGEGLRPVRIRQIHELRARSRALQRLLADSADLRMCLVLLMWNK